MQSRNVSRLKFACLTDSDCTELLDVFSPADALHIKYPLEPITIYATKQEIDQFQYRPGLIRITEIGEYRQWWRLLKTNTSTIYMKSAQISNEAQTIMDMVRHEYITNLHDVSTDIMRIHMDPEFWYQQHNPTAMFIIWTIIWLTWYRSTWGEMQPKWKRTSSSVLWFTSTRIER